MAPLAAGITDRNVEAAEALHRIVHEFPAERLVKQVPRDGEARPARSLDHVDDLAGIRFFVREVIDGLRDEAVSYNVSRRDVARLAKGWRPGQATFDWISLNGGAMSHIIDSLTRSVHPRLERLYRHSASQTKSMKVRQDD